MLNIIELLRQEIKAVKNRVGRGIRAIDAMENDQYTCMHVR